MDEIESSKLQPDNLELFNDFDRLRVFHDEAIAANDRWLAAKIFKQILDQARLIDQRCFDERLTND
ncbi:MAG: hypothetical protein JXQ99_19770 [Hyphomicrobiaceae bacterium]